MAAVPYAWPISASENNRAPVESSADAMYVLSVTNHAPQTKYWRNIMAERRGRRYMGRNLIRSWNRAI